MSLEEPPMKKQKNDVETELKLDKDILYTYKNSITKSQLNLKAVLADEYVNTVETTKAYIGFIKDMKNISKAIKLLNEKLPLNQLSHLKRVRKSYIVIGHVNDFKSAQDVEEFIESNLPELVNIFGHYKEIEVPVHMPKLKWQYQQTQNIWACNFHPDMYMERISGDNFFSNQEVCLHRKYMAVNFETVRWYWKSNKVAEDDIKQVNASVVVDPSSESVVAVSFDNRQEHPMQHSAMLAIDNVARTQDGGAWMSNTHTEPSQSGIDKDLLEYLKECFPDIKFGAKKFVSKKDLQLDEDYTGPYLCTYYSIYMLKEPCFMCSMALTHARVKRVFYCFQNKESGALVSKGKLHTVQSLNHRYEVFTGFL